VHVFPLILKQNVLNHITPTVVNESIAKTAFLPLKRWDKAHPGVFPAFHQCVCAVNGSCGRVFFSFLYVFLQYSRLYIYSVSMEKQKSWNAVLEQFALRRCFVPNTESRPGIVQTIFLQVPHSPPDLAKNVAFNGGVVFLSVKSFLR